MKTRTTVVTRRGFLRATTAAAATTFMVVPRRVVAGGAETPPSERLNIAGIGVGGMGAGDIAAVARDNNIVALCDVDERRAAQTLQKFPNARRFRDFRKMFDEMEREIDAVVVATPDHTHAVAAMAAIKRGKHVYCEKPLAHSVHEVRALMRAAKEHNVVTQLGNQGHSFDTIRDFCEWIWAGAIGKVHTIHAGCEAVNSGLDQLAELGEQHAVPSTLDWDLWLGPAKQRPYHPAYLPGRWRGWVPFGNGTLGDWVCHVVDPVFWALDLGAPSSVVTQINGDYDPVKHADVFPKGEKTTFQFPAKGDRGPVTLHWYSGTERIPHLPELGDEEPVRTGAIVLGDKGTIMYGSHGAGGVRLVPSSRMDSFQRPEKTIPRVKEHHWDWVDAIRNGRKAGSDFSYGGPLTEIAMLGVIALKFPGQVLEWDGEAARFKNLNAANAWINPPYREGWSL